jgi:oxygen-dependent protoporphyrinogen oxidase
VTGVIADTYSYPERQPPNTTVLTVMLGGTHFYKHFPTDLHHQPKSEQRQRLVKYAVDFLHEHRIISRAPDIIDTGVQMYPYAVPQYHCGHRQTLDTIHQCLLQQFNGRLSVTAASYLGIGMPDCMMNAWRLADKVCESVSSTTTMTSSLPKATITGLE